VLSDAPMRLTAIVVFVLVLAACGGGDDSEQQTDAEAAATASETSAAMSKKKPAGARDASTGAAVKQARRPRGTEGLRVPARRARIVAKESDFGRVLFDAHGQVVYVFEPDRRNRSNCTSAECVKAWPPVLTREAPSAGEGVNAGLLGTLRRRDGSLQVTYGGRPLYFYEHEAPGEIKCHNVDLHGGLWWVVTPQGDPAS
jgi:predicted lipoprotein with Yx(FWY)xxD motif